MMSHQRLTVFDIEKDLASDKVLKAVRKGSTRETGEFLFDPDEMKGMDAELKFEKHRKSEDELRNFAKMATEIRTMFKQKASVLHEESKDGYSNEVDKALDEVPKLKR